MTAQTWFITGVNSGFGRELAEQLLAAGHRVAGTVRREGTADDLIARYGSPSLGQAAEQGGTHGRDQGGTPGVDRGGEQGGRFWLGHLDVTDLPAVRATVDAAFAALGRIDVVVPNAGYGLFGAAEEVSDEQVVHQISTNLLGTIQTVRAALPHLRAQGGGRLIAISSVAGIGAHPGASLYHASKWGVEGFMEAVAHEVEPFGIGVTLVEPGGARTSFAHGSLQMGEPLPAYAGTPAGHVHTFAAQGGPPLLGDPAKMAARIIESAGSSPAPLRLVLGSDSYAVVTAALRTRLAQLEPQQSTATTTDA